MNRRQWLKHSSVGGGALGLPWLFANLAGRAAQESPAVGGKKLPPLQIDDVKTILAAPAGIRLVIVKVLTSEPGLYGLGCATFTQRPRVVETAVDKYLKPFLVGKDPLRIEDIWQACHLSSCWRNGPVLGNALSGVDMACWDILGKRAGLPVYQLLGGKCRRAVDTYRHASGNTFQEVEQAVRRFTAQGYRHVRVQVAIPGVSAYPTRTLPNEDKAKANARTCVWEPRAYARTVRPAASACVKCPGYPTRSALPGMPSYPDPGPRPVSNRNGCHEPPIFPRYPHHDLHPSNQLEAASRGLNPWKLPGFSPSRAVTARSPASRHGGPWRCAPGIPPGGPGRCRPP
jgi:hypothetical protein